MRGIRIRDLDGPTLAFDLGELLKILGTAAVTSKWKCVVDQFVPTDDARPNLVAAYEDPSGVDGAELISLAAETLQIIDGRFEAFRQGEANPWLCLEAIDSTYWEVSAANPADLSAFRQQFRQIEDL